MSTLSLPLLLAAAAAFGWSFCDLTRRVAARRMPAWPLAVWVTLGALPILTVWCVAEDAWRLEPARYLGPGLGAIGINWLKSYATHAFPEQWPYILGLLFIFVTLFMPKGLVGLPGQLKELKAKWFRPPKADDALPATAAKANSTQA